MNEGSKSEKRIPEGEGQDEIRQITDQETDGQKRHEWAIMRVEGRVLPGGIERVHRRRHWRNAGKGYLDGTAKNEKTQQKVSAGYQRVSGSLRCTGRLNIPHCSQ